MAWKETKPTRVLTIVLWFAFFTHAVASFLDEDTVHVQIRDDLFIRWVYPLIFTGWILADARSRGRKACYDFDTFVFLTWPILGPIYLYQTRRKKAFWTLVGLGIVIALAFGSASLVMSLLAGCGIPCSNTIKISVTSPDGKYVATAFVRDCGATTDFSPQVHLRLVGEPLAETGNVFIGNHSDEITIEWLSTSNLVIYSNCETVRWITNHFGIIVEKRAQESN